MAEYKYSKIKSVEVKNFRNIGEAKVDWDESPIVCLVGENEAGKTSFNMAVSVLAGHKNPRDQISYIREGTDGFGVQLELEDGHKIIRMKTKDLNGYMVSKDDKTLYQTSKIGEGLPVQVSDLMGIIEEPETGEFLQFRTYEDNVLFAYTTASTNYKMIYGALKVEQLTKAIKFGNVEVNELRAEKDRLEIAEGTVMGQIRSIQIIDTSSIEKVRERVVSLLEQCKKVENLEDKHCELKEAERKLSVLNELSSLEEIDASILDKLHRTMELKKDSIVEVPDVHGLEEIDIRILDRVSRVIESMRDAKEEVPNIDGLAEVDVKAMGELETLLEYKKRLREQEELLRKSLVEQEELEAEHREIMEMLKENGIKIVTCPRCGETIPFEESEALG